MLAFQRGVEYNSDILINSLHRGNNMSSINTTQINLIEALPAIYTINQPTQREIDSLVSWVKREGKVSYFDVSVVLESAVIAAATKVGLLVEANNYLTLPVVEVAAAPVAEPQQEVIVVEASPTIDEQINQLANSNDPAFRQAAAMYQDCLNGDWLERLVKEDLMNLENELEVEKAAKEAKDLAIAAYHKALALDGQILAIEGLKLKNLDRNDSYWLFVGNYYQCEAAQLALLHDHLISSALKPNSKDGTCWKLIVDRLARGYIETRHLQEAIEKAA